MQRLILAAVLSGSAALAAAQEEAAPKAHPEPPTRLPAPYQGETVEPEVIIRETEQERIYEYRIRGRVYMVKVEPQVGPPYYLLDTNGDGRLDTREDRAGDNALSQWLLFSW